MNGEVVIEKGHSADVNSDEEVEDIKVRLCTACSCPITERYFLKTNDACWHEKCLLCCVCCVDLKDVCYYKDGRVFCKEDYSRIHGCKCSGCDVFISPNELVMKALQNVYHVDCFKCSECGDKLEKGDEFILKDDKLFCSADFNVADPKFDTGDIFSSDEYDSMSTVSAASPNTQDKVRNNSNSNCKRPRTILTSQQREDFKAAFELTPKPCRKVREQLSNETGLSVRVVQVWFQNQRAKLKKIQKKSEGSSVTTNVEKVKKTNGGKVTKKKRTKSTSSIKSESSGSSTTDFNLPTITSSVTQSFHSIMDTFNSMSHMLTDNAADKSEDENNNNNILSINTTNNNNNNNGVLSCGGSDISSSAESSINNSPNVTFDQQQQSPDEYSSSTFRPLINPFSRGAMMQTNTSSYSNEPMYTDTFPTASASTINDYSSSVKSAHFQMMPHLMNSFV